MSEERFCAAQFGPVMDAFVALHDENRMLGGALSVWYQGVESVRLVAGSRDSDARLPWNDTTLVNVFSVGKPFAALAALYWVARGKIDLDAPVGDRWHEYSNSGKERTTLRDILSHRSGQASFPETARQLAPTDKDGLMASLASSAPDGTPGEMIAEHALTYGHLIDGVLAAAGVASVAETTRMISGQFGWDIWFGVPDDRLADVAYAEALEVDWSNKFLHDADGRPTPYLRIPDRAIDLDTINSPDWRAASFPAVGMHASAFGLGKFYSTLADPSGPVGTVLGSELHREYISLQSDGFDGFLGRNAQWSLGFNCADGSIGMGGIGGSNAWTHPELGYSFAFVTRSLSATTRAADLATILEECIRRERAS